MTVPDEKTLTGSCLVEVVVCSFNSKIISDGDVADIVWGVDNGT